MCPFVIVVIMIALILFMPAVYAMGMARGIIYERHHECLDGGPGNYSKVGEDSKTSAQKGIASTQTPTKCTKCAKMKYCMDPTPEMAVFCM